jgi:hypothetical protein
MRRFALVLSLAAFSLTACTGTLPSPTAAPAPLAATTVDDVALEKTWRAFDLALDAINLLGDAGKIVPGTPKGKAVASGIRRVLAALQAAEHAAAAGSTTSYRTALDEATQAIADLRVALRS